MKEKQHDSIEAGCCVSPRLQIEIRAQFAVELVAALGRRVVLRGTVEMKALFLVGRYNQFCLDKR